MLEIQHCKCEKTCKLNAFQKNLFISDHFEIEPVENIINYSRDLDFGRKI